MTSIDLCWGKVTTDCSVGGVSTKFVALTNSSVPDIHCYTTFVALSWWLTRLTCPFISTDSGINYLNANFVSACEYLFGHWQEIISMPNLNQGPKLDR